MIAVPKGVTACNMYVVPSSGVDALPVDLQRFVTGLREVDRETQGEETVVSSKPITKVAADYGDLFQGCWLR